MINWIKRGHSKKPEIDQEYLFWIEEYLGDGEWSGYASVENFIGVWPGDSTHWAYINEPED